MNNSDRIVIYHNPRCRKSRDTLKILEERKENPVIINYLEEPIDPNKLKEIIGLLGITPFELLRRGESVFKDTFKGQSLTDREWTQAMCDHPKLMERPIVIKGGKAVIGRPPEKVLEIL